LVLKLPFGNGMQLGAAMGWLELVVQSLSCMHGTQ
jgi:hypothetical protein